VKWEDHAVQPHASLKTIWEVFFGHRWGVPLRTGFMDLGYCYELSWVATPADKVQGNTNESPRSR